MFCTNCGAQLPDDASFCTNCGTPVGPTTQAPAGPDDATAVIAGTKGARQAGRQANQSGAAGGPDDSTQALSALGDDPDPWAKNATTQGRDAWQGYRASDSPQAGTPYQVQRTEQFATAEAGQQPDGQADVVRFAGEGDGKPRGGSSPAPAIVAVVAIVAVAAVLYLFVLAPSFGLPTLPSMRGGDAASTTATTSDATSGDAASSESSLGTSAQASTSASSAASTASAASDTAEAEITSDLTTHYDRLGSYDSDIKDAARTFNADYLKDSIGTRQSDRDRAAKLSADLHDELTAVRALAVPSDSPHYQTHQDIIACYDDLCHRIDVIVESWDISLQYSSPSGHSDEITAPITRDNDADDNNIYKMDFDDRYPACKP